MMTRLFARALLALALPLAVRAQLPDSATAGRDSARLAVPRRLEAVHVTGTRLAPGSGTDLAARVDALSLGGTTPAPAGVAAALARLPGVAVFDDQGTRAQPTLELRGFALSPVVGVSQGVSVFLDGVRVNEADAQQVNLDLLPIEAIDSAEVVRGPAVLFGKNTLGGAVLLTTRRGDADGAPVEGSVSGGAFGYREAHARVGGASALGDGVLLVRGSDEDGWRRDTPATTRLAFASLGRRGERGDVALTALAARDRIYQAGSLPESWLAVDPRANYTGGDFAAPALLHLALRGERRTGLAVLRASAYGRALATEQFNVNVGDPSTRAFVRSRSWGATVEAARELSSGSWRSTLTLGGELSRHRVRYRVLAEPTAGAPDLPDDCDPAGECERARVAERDSAAFAQLRVSPAARLAVTLAARADRVTLPFRDERDPANDGTGRWQRISPRVAVDWRATSALRLYAVRGTGFRTPAALELACADETAPCPLPFSLGDDPPLRPVTVVSTEAGAEWGVGAFAADVSVYRADARDEIVFAASSRTAGYFTNVPRTRRQGIELSARAALPAGARIAASWALTNAGYESAIRLASAVPDAGATAPGDRFPLVPARRARLELGLTRLLGALVVDGSVGAGATSSQFLRGDESNELPRLPAYTTLDARLRLERAWWSLAVAADNLLDRRFATFGVYALNPLGAPGATSPAASPRLERFLTPGYPRQLTVSATVRR